MPLQGTNLQILGARFWATQTCCGQTGVTLQGLLAPRSSPALLVLLTQRCCGH